MKSALRWLPTGAAAAAVVAVFACSSPDATPAAPDGGGGDAGHLTDGGTGDATPLNACDGSAYVPTHEKADLTKCSGPLPVLKVMKGGQLVDPDWSCLGQDSGAGGADAGDSGTDAASGDAGDVDGGPPPNSNLFDLQAFGSSNSPMANIDVEIFNDNIVFDRAPSFTGTTAGPDGGVNGARMGQFWFPHPVGPRMAYRVKAVPEVTQQMIDFDLAVPAAPGKVSGNGIAPSKFKTLAIAAVPISGWTPPEDLGIVVSPPRDCAGNDLEGAVGQLVDEETCTVVPGGTGKRDVHYVYFGRNELPESACTFSNADSALLVIINAPNNTEGVGKGHKYSLRFLGRMTESATEPVVFARRPLEVFPNSINIVHPLPH